MPFKTKPRTLEVWEAKYGNRTAIFRIALPTPPLEILREAKHTFGIAGYSGTLYWGDDRGEFVLSAEHVAPAPVIFLRRTGSYEIPNTWNNSKSV